MARHLPRESALVQAIAGEPASWSTTDYLLAAVVDGVNYLLWSYVSAHSKSRPKKPTEVPRPRAISNTPRRRMSSGSEIAQFFAGLNRR